MSVGIKPKKKKVGPSVKRKGLSKPKKPRVNLRTNVKGMKQGIYGIEYRTKPFGPITLGPKKKK